MGSAVILTIFPHCCVYICCADFC